MDKRIPERHFSQVPLLDAKGGVMPFLMRCGDTSMNGIPKTAREEFKRIVAVQFRLHAGMEIQDLYKLLYQMAFGGAHLLGCPEKAKKAFEEEWKTPGKTLRGEALFEMIDPFGELVRINLRVWKKRGGDPELLWPVLMESARQFQGNENRLHAYWELACEMAQKRMILLSCESLSRYWEKMKKARFPAEHHSAGYGAANRPSYRLLCRSLWPKNGE